MTPKQTIAHLSGIVETTNALHARAGRPLVDRDALFASVLACERRHAAPRPADRYAAEVACRWGAGDEDAFDAPAPEAL